MSRQELSSKKDNSWIIWTIILILLLGAIAVLSVYTVKLSIKRGVDAAKKTFLESYEDTRNDTYAHYYNSAFKYSEETHHVSNNVTISVHSIKEKSILEVLSVSDVVYIIADGSTSNSGTTSWLKVSGTGVYTANLAAAEYIIDNERHNVLVRVPQPVLDSSNITIDEYESLYFSENVWRHDNSVKSGEALAQNQLSEAKQQIQEDFEANQQYSQFAESSAESILIALIKGINPDVADLKVEVEFY